MRAPSCLAVLLVGYISACASPDDEVSTTTLSDDRGPQAPWRPPYDASVYGDGAPWNDPNRISLELRINGTPLDDGGRPVPQGFNPTQPLAGVRVCVHGLEHVIPCVTTDVGGMAKLVGLPKRSNDLVIWLDRDGYLSAAVPTMTGPESVSLGVYSWITMMPSEGDLAASVPDLIVDDTKGSIAVNVVGPEAGLLSSPLTVIADAEVDLLTAEIDPVYFEALEPRLDASSTVGGVTLFFNVPPAEHRVSVDHPTRDCEFSGRLLSLGLWGHRTERANVISLPVFVDRVTLTAQFCVMNPDGGV